MPSPVSKGCATALPYAHSGSARRARQSAPSCAAISASVGAASGQVFQPRQHGSVLRALSREEQRETHARPQTRCAQQAAASMSAAPPGDRRRATKSACMARAGSMRRVAERRPRPAMRAPRAAHAAARPSRRDGRGWCLRGPPWCRTGPGAALLAAPRRAAAPTAARAASSRTARESRAPPRRRRCAGRIGERQRRRGSGPQRRARAAKRRSPASDQLSPQRGGARRDASRRQSPGTGAQQARGRRSQPRCVLMPPVAASMRASAAMP